MPALLAMRAPVVFSPEDIMRALYRNALEEVAHGRKAGFTVAHHPGGRQQQVAARNPAEVHARPNDSVTVAVEIPIWLTEEDITALER